MLFRIKAGIIAVIVCGTASTAAWAQSACADRYAAGTPPRITVSLPAGSGTELCYSLFAVSHSATFRTPSYSAEHLTRDDAVGGDKITRKDAFHTEKKLPKTERASLADYAGFKGIWDRGHMTPANDAPDTVSQKETFSLANMVPQASQLNQGIWRHLEASLHALAEQDGDLFLVTGPIYTAQPTWLHKHVAVPDYTFKAVYDPKSGRATAYVAANRNDGKCWAISVAQLIQMAGIDPFPTVAEAVKADPTPWSLPPGTDDSVMPDCASPSAVEGG